MTHEHEHEMPGFSLETTGAQRAEGVATGVGVPWDSQPEPTLAHPLGWLKEPPDPKDKQLAAAHPELLASPLKALPRKISMRGEVPLMNQANTNGCVGHGIYVAFMHALLAAGLKPWDASPSFIYHCARKVMGGNWASIDQGAYIRDGMKGLGLYGVSSRAAYPDNQPLLTPSQAAFLEALSHQAIEYTSVPKDIMQIKTVLASRIPVVVGFNVYQGYSNQPGGRWPDRVGTRQGGHCVAALGYDDDRGDEWQVEEQGSWGPQFGDAGYHWMKWSYLLSEGDDFWMLRLVEGEPVTPPTPQPSPVFDVTQISDDAFDAEFNRRYGGYGPLDISQGFKKTTRRWTGHFEAT